MKAKLSKKSEHQSAWQAPRTKAPGCAGGVSCAACSSGVEEGHGLGLKTFGQPSTAAQSPERNIPYQAKRGASQTTTGQGRPQVGSLPTHLKTRIETLSGVSMDGVKVHRNSPAPAQVGALAYAQGRDIHLGPGQDQHIHHEAWHVVQQAQGRVTPTGQVGGASLNDSAHLEREADVMGRQVANCMPSVTPVTPMADISPNVGNVIQRMQAPGGQDPGKPPPKKPFSFSFAQTVKKNLPKRPNVFEEEEDEEPATPAQPARAPTRPPMFLPPRSAGPPPNAAPQQAAPNLIMGPDNYPRNFGSYQEARDATRPLAQAYRDQTIGFRGSAVAGNSNDGSRPFRKAGAPRPPEMGGHYQVQPRGAKNKEAYASDLDAFVAGPGMKSQPGVNAAGFPDRGSRHQRVQQSFQQSVLHSSGTETSVKFFNQVPPTRNDNRDVNLMIRPHTPERERQGRSPSPPPRRRSRSRDRDDRGYRRGGGRQRGYNDDRRDGGQRRDRSRSPVRDTPYSRNRHERRYERSRSRSRSRSSRRYRRYDRGYDRDYDYSRGRDRSRSPRRRSRSRSPRRRK